SAPLIRVRSLVRVQDGPYLLTMNESQAPKSARVELFLLSMVSLFLELLIIRWMSSDIVAFSVFKTFPLVTCFVGLGLGFAAGLAKLFRYAPLALLQLVVFIKLVDYFKICYWFFPSVSIFSWGNVDLLGQHLWYYVLAFVLVLIVLLMGPFAVMAGMGARLGVLFNQFKPLEAYCVNIGGSIAGSILFSIASFSGFPPLRPLF